MKRFESLITLLVLIWLLNTFGGIHPAIGYFLAFMIYGATSELLKPSGSVDVESGPAR